MIPLSVTNALFRVYIIDSSNQRAQNQSASLEDRRVRRGSQGLCEGVAEYDEAVHR